MSKKPKRRIESPARPASPAVWPVHSVQTRRLVIVLRVTGFAFLCATLLAWLRPDLRVWGIHHLAFLPSFVAGILVGLAVVMWTPLGGRIVERLTTRLRFLSGRSALLAAAVAVVLFFSFKVSVPILGDGPLWIKELAWIGEFEARGRHVPAKRWTMRKEPFELGAHELVFRVAAKMRPPDLLGGTRDQNEAALKKREQWFHQAAWNVYAYMAVLAGGLLVFLALRFARRRIAPDSRAPFLLLLLTGSGVLLFFGYVENYTWFSLSLIAFLLAALDETSPPRRFPIKTLLTGLLTVGFHLAGTIFVPALVFVILNWALSGKGGSSGRLARPECQARLVTLVFGVLALAGYVYKEGWEGWVSIMPLVPSLSKDGYAILSLQHAVDLVNVFALTLIPAVVVLIASLGHRDATSHERTQRAFLILSCAAGVLFVCIFNPNLSMSRDWDLMAAALWPVVVTAGWSLARARLDRFRAHVLAAVVGFALILSLPFVLGQAFPSSALARYETLLRMDPSRSAYGWENLAIYHEARGDLQNRLHCWREAYEVDRNPRYQINVGIALRLLGRLDEAERELRAAVQRNPKFASQLIFLAEDFRVRGDYARARDLLHLVRESDPSEERAQTLLAWLDKRLPPADTTRQAQTP